MRERIDARLRGHGKQVAVVRHCRRGSPAVIWHDARKRDRYALLRTRASGYISRILSLCEPMTIAFARTASGLLKPYSSKAFIGVTRFGPRISSDSRRCLYTRSLSRAKHARFAKLNFPSVTRVHCAKTSRFVTFRQIAGHSLTVPPSGT
jgi:hypothetical protein